MTILQKASDLFEFCRRMGLRYTVFRLWHEIQIRTGLLKLRFPARATHGPFISIGLWRKLPVYFFFGAGDIEVVRDRSLLDLESKAVNASQNKFRYFSHKLYHVPDWHTNPLTGFSYDPHQHWTTISDFSRDAGDIKFVWEKSRFTFLYDLIRYDFHFEKDQSESVLWFMEDWIDQNPVNCGPNWRCGQEITLRVLNWVFALQYYSGSENLTVHRFNRLIASIYDQMRHVEAHIQFSLIAVRNNHALTECLGFYLVGLLFPFFSESKRWKKKGKKWFENEIRFQIADDGTFLQSSVNYHRVVVQLLTWAIRLAELNNERWDDIVYERASKSLFFLQACQDTGTGELPNYGNNDGALFFPLTSCSFRDFRPQLAALANVLGVRTHYGLGEWNEEAAWLGKGLDAGGDEPMVSHSINALNFPIGGYYVLRDPDTITFLRCGKYSNRPFQADNLHLDIWVNGENIIRDAGSFLYNTDENWTGYFSGTASHNTVMLGGLDQMRKGARFIWHDWIEYAKGAAWTEENAWLIEAEFAGFKQLGSKIVHQRKVVKQAGHLHWIIEDRIGNMPEGIFMHQIWHPSEYFFNHFNISSFEENGREIMSRESTGWYSGFYGDKVSSRRLVFSTGGRFIRTVIWQVSESSI
jgi:hypothetical protein